MSDERENSSPSIQNECVLMGSNSERSRVISNSSSSADNLANKDWVRDSVSSLLRDLFLTEIRLRSSLNESDSISIQVILSFPYSYFSSKLIFCLDANFDFSTVTYNHCYVFRQCITPGLKTNLPRVRVSAQWGRIICNTSYRTLVEAAR